MLLVLILLGCQEPFGERRQDLSGFRIASLTAPAAQPGDTTTPIVSVVVKGRLWSDEPVSLLWHWVDPDPQEVWALSPDTPPTATGPSPSMQRPDADSWLALLAVTTEGEEARAFLEVATEHSDVSELSGLSWSGLDLHVNRITAEDLTVEAREAEPLLDTLTVERHGFLRFEAQLASPSPDVTVRWMATQGTWLELDPVTADWTPGHLELDGEDLDAAAKGEEGAVSVLALALDDEGHGSAMARDLWVGEPPPGMYSHGRWLGGTPHTGWILARLEGDDASPSGLSLADITPTTLAELPDDDPHGTDALPCAEGEPFDPNWLLQQRCARADVLGHTVALWVESTP
jgi:hypothetical protein